MFLGPSNPRDYVVRTRHSFGGKTNDDPLGAVSTTSKTFGLGMRFLFFLLFFI